MKIKGGIASKREAVVDSQGRLLVDLVGGGGGFTPASPMVIISGDGTFTLTGGFQALGAPIGPFELTFTTAGIWQITWQLSGLLALGPVVNEISSRIEIDTGAGFSAVVGTEVTIGRNQSPSGIGAVRASGTGVWPLPLAVGDKIRVTANGSPGSGDESIASFTPPGRYQMTAINIGP